MEKLTHQDLKKIIIFSWEKIEKNKGEINKINVFPVPDQDTGTNLAKTLFGIKRTVEQKDFKDLEEISETILEAALSSAQGNVGVIYTGFLMGFLKKINKNPIDVKKLAEAFKAGAEKARKSIFSPKEGTILDVIDASAKTFQEESEKEKNILYVLEKTIKNSKEALLQTREKMEVLKRANVVDAGGLGFLMILESYLETLTSSPSQIQKSEIPSEKIKKFVQILSHRYEIVALIDEIEVEEKKVREKLGKLGNSLDIVQIGNKMKIHIHTDYPDEVKKEIKNFGRIEDLREEDMAKEVVGESSIRKVSIGLVTEDVVSLPSEILEKYQIEIAKTYLDWPELESFSGENIYQKIRMAWQAGTKTMPKTSQPSPKSYFDAFKKQLQRFEKVLAITLSSKLSGSFNSAFQAREMLEEEEKEKVFIFDTKNGAGGQDLFVLKAIELIQESKEIEEILEKLESLIPKTHLYVLFEDPKGLEFSGRISTSQANWIRKIKKIGLFPIIELKDGKLEKGGIVFAKNMAVALFKKFLRDSKKEKDNKIKIRTVINHADNIEMANKLKETLKSVGVEVSFISEAPALFCAVLGPGTISLGWQPKE